MVPKLSRVAFFGTSTSHDHRTIVKGGGTRRRGIWSKAKIRGHIDPKDIETAFRAAGEGRAGAVLVLPVSIFNSNRKQIVELAVNTGCQRYTAIQNTS